MNKPFAALALFIFLELMLPAHSSGRPFYLSPCTAVEIPLEIPNDSGLELEKHEFCGGVKGGGTIILKNHTGRAIDQITLDVVYLDSKGAVLFGIPYRGGASRFHWTYLGGVFRYEGWPHPVPPNESLLLDGTNLLSTTEKPAKAVFTIMDIRFGDKTQKTFVGAIQIESRNETFLINALPTWFPYSFQIPVFSGTLPDELQLAASIDRRGRVTKVDFAGAPVLPERIAEQIKSQIMQWRFYPETRSGRGVDSRLNLVLCFYPAMLPAPKNDCPYGLGKTYPRLFAQVELSQEEPGGTEWRITYGGWPAGGHFDGGRIGPDEEIPAP